MEYAAPVAALRAQVKDMQWQAEKKRRDAAMLLIAADAIASQATDLDLLTDRIEQAQEPRP